MEIHSDDLKIFVTVVDSGTLSAASAHPGYRQQIHAVYYRNTQLSRRISCFLEFLQNKL